MRYAITLTAVAIGFALGGCVPDMDLPKDFVGVSKADLEGHHVRGISADGVVVGLRSEDNAENGTVDFWAQAIQDELKAGRGYELQASEDVKSRSGLEGKLMTFATHQRGATFTYMLAIYVKSGKVLLAEAGGKADAVKKYSEPVREALLSVR